MERVDAEEHEQEEDDSEDEEEGHWVPVSPSILGGKGRGGGTLTLVLGYEILGILLPLVA